MTCIEEKESIYIKKNVCLFVRYAFSPYNSYRHQTFHDTPQVQRKIERGLTRPLGGGGVVEGGLGEISPSLGVLLFRLIFQRFEKITYELY